MSKRLTELLDREDYNAVLDDQVRQVRWLYNNSNKCTKVYNEKLVRLIVQRLQNRINELERITLVDYEAPNNNKEIIKESFLTTDNF